MTKFRILNDMFLNIVAATVPIVVLQILVFPNVANHISESSYGLLIAIYSLINIIPGTIGTTLNNIRLLHSNKYSENNYVGDFMILVFIGSVLNIIAISIGTVIIESRFNITNSLIVIAISIFALLHDYLMVEFRIKLNYKLILIDRLIMSFGYIIGMVIFILTKNWYFIFLIAHFIGFIFVAFKTSLLKENRIKTPLFSYILKDSFLFLVGAFLLKLTSYADKLLLYPIMGGASVAIYYSATILSKMVSLAITPINSVALSYLSKLNEKPKKLFWKVFILGVFVCFTGYFLSIILSETILKILYPMFVDEAIKYIYITSASTVLHVLGSIIQPFVLKFCSMKFQIVINSVDVFIYTGLSLLLLNTYGLMGFCIGVMISKIIKVIMLLLVYATSKNETIVLQ